MTGVRWLSSATPRVVWCVQLTLWVVLVVGFTVLKGVNATIFLNKWAVEILGGPEVADKVADDYGFRNLGQIGSLENYYLFEQRRLVKRSTTPSRHHHVRLRKSPQVVWIEQQSVKRRFKREHKVELDRWKPKLNDPVWPEMWYLNQGARGGHDMNVISAWRLGYTGKGVVVTILDDGIEHTHSDLQQNYDADASFDINDSDADPMPRYDKADENRHGTRCAGEVAAVANNSRCGVGVAFQARIGGVRMLDGDVSDYVEAQALGLNPQHVDIYSASWGPEDNGKVVDGPAKLAKEAFMQGVLKGRGGKGSIYVWASGNGGSMSDSCSCDGYANSIYTLSVSSTSEFGTKPWYLEECSSTLATTYSSGENYKERKIVTTDLHNRCIDNHTGTSASAPLAAGICALALEANADLTWRDMQYIVLLTARSEPLRDAQWVVNGVGRPVSHRYGYGLMDGQAMVLLAERWTTVPEQHVCMTEVVKVDQQIDGSGISVTLDTDGCKDSVNEVNYLEHVQAKVSLTYSRRGDLQIHLISPNGTRSMLLPRRKYDYQPGEFKNWSFMSVFYWGERPQGVWTLVLENVGPPPNSGIFEKWQLVMYGTKDDPVILRDTTPKRPIVHVPAQGEDRTELDFDSFVTLSGWNLTESESSSSASLPVTRPKAGGSVKQKTKVGLKTTAKDAGKGRKTTVVMVTTSPKQPVEDTDKGMVTKGTVAKGTVAEKVTEIVGVTAKESVITKGKEKLSDTTVESPNVVGTVFDVMGKEKTPSHALHNVTVSESNELIVSEKGTLTPFVCDVECTSEGCTGPAPTDCVACQHAQFNGRCVSSCPSLTFYDPMSGLCYHCQFPCLECSDPDEEGRQKCLNCEHGYFLHEEGNATSCVEHCPLEHYADVDQKRCIQCSLNCLICVDDPMNCLRCVDDFESVNSICTQNCELSEYRDEEGSCQSCDFSCEMCVGPDATDCLTCAVDMMQENDLCVANCSEGYYVEMLEAGLVCEMCHPSCSTCFGPEEEECFSCFHPLKHFATSCLEECPTGHFEDNDAVCHICHENCSTCIGPRENDCLNCPPTRFYFDGRCSDNCSDGLFAVEVYSHVTEGMTNRCELCHGTCQMCSGGSPVDCIHCFKGLVLSSGRCVAHCESHKYQEYDQCWECHKSCATCFGPMSDQCLDCPDGHYSHGGQCLTDCPHGYYRMDGHCLFCSMECDGCNDYGADNCLGCSGGFLMHEGSCIIPLLALFRNCSHTQFYNTAHRRCESCHDSCRSCNGTGLDECLSCFVPNVLHLESGECLPCCNDVDIFSDVSRCCSCSYASGLCVELWDYLRPEMTTAPDVTSTDLGIDHDIVAPDVSTADTIVQGTSSVLSSTTSSTPSVLSISPETTFIPVTSSLLPRWTSLPPSRVVSAKHRTKTSTSSTFGVPPSSTSPAGVSPVSRSKEVTRPVESTEIHVTTFTPPLTVTSSGQDDVMETTSNPVFLSPWVLALFVLLCFASMCVVVLIVVFCLCSAKSGNKVCWSKRCYRPVPMLYRGSQRSTGGKSDVTLATIRQV